MYPRVKVRVQEEEDHSPPPIDSQSSLLLKLIESLSQQEKENKISSPPSVTRITKAYVTSPAAKSLSAAKDAGTDKNNMQIGKDAKSNAKAKSVPPPRAVLSSPDNDGMIGSRNKLNYARSSASKKRPVERINPAGQTHKNYPSPSVTPRSQNTRKGPKTENHGVVGRMLKDPSKPVVQRLGF